MTIQDQLNQLIQSIQPIYDNTPEDQIYKIQANNQHKGKEALELIKTILVQDPNDIDARLWRIKLYNDWVWDDHTKMLEDIEHLIDHHPDTEAKLIGYDWLTWLYIDRLQIQESTLNHCQDYLIEISRLPKEKRYLSDNHFSKCHWRMASIYREKNEYEEACRHYILSHQHKPFETNRNYECFTYLLENNFYKESAQTALDFNFWADDVSAFKPYSDIVIKDLEFFFKNHLEVAYIHICYARDYFLEYGFKNLEDFYTQYLPYIQEMIDSFPNRYEGYVLMLYYLINYKKNNKLSFELLEEYFTNVPNHGISYLSNYIELGLKLGKKIPIDKISLGHTNAIELYNEMTCFLELYNETNNEKEETLAIYYINIAEKIGRAGYNQFLEYFEKGEGHSSNNERHTFAKHCNNFAIVLGNKLWFINKNNMHEGIREAIYIHAKGYEYSPFWENLSNLIDKAYRGRFHDLMIKYAPLWFEEVTKYYTEYVSPEDYIKMYQYLISAYSSLDQYEKADEYWEILMDYFNKIDDYSIEIIEAMLLASNDYLISLNDRKLLDKVEHICEDFYKKPLVQNLFPSLANFFYHQTLGYMNDYLGNLDQMHYHFTEALNIINGDLRDYFYQYDHEIENIKTYIEDASISKEKKQELQKRMEMPLNSITHYSEFNKDIQAQDTINLLNYYFEGKNNLTSYIWNESKTIYLELQNKIPREEDPNTIDYIITLNFKKSNEWIRINAIEWLKEKRGFLGFGKSTEIIYTFYISYAIDDTDLGNGIYNYVEHDELPNHLNKKVLRIFNQWMSRLDVNR